MKGGACCGSVQGKGIYAASVSGKGIGTVASTVLAPAATPAIAESWLLAVSGFAVMIDVQLCVYKVLVVPLPSRGGLQFRVEVAHVVG